jgi:competence ComEA-like helix-hairpin-helix protein
MIEWGGMKAKDRHLSLVALALLMSAAVLGMRFEARARDEAMKRREAGRETFCVGVAHPAIAPGLVCATAAGQILPRAVERLQLPERCAGVPLSASLKRGERIALRDNQGKCEIEGIAPLPGGNRILAGAGIDINKADVAALTLLPGIGEARAQAIADYRSRHGPFESPEALTEIRGIGERTVERIAPWLDAP